MSKPTIKTMELETEIGPVKVSAEKGEVLVEHHPNPELAQVLAAGFVAMMRDVHTARNYLELLLTDDRDGKRITVTVQYVDGETPGEKAARKAKTAKDAFELCEDLIGYASRYFRDKYDYDEELERLRREVER